MNSLKATYDQFQNTWKSLQRQWQAICDLWDDPMRRQFEKEFWQPLETRMPATLKEMERLAQVIAQARWSVH